MTVVAEHWIRVSDSVNCLVRPSLRARHLRLCVHRDGRVILTLPRRVPLYVGERFVRSRHAWIGQALKKWQTRSKNRLVLSAGPYRKDKPRALAFVHEKIAQFNQFYQFRFHAVRIKNPKTKWGSCSRKGFLNFNYKILYLPEALADYLVVHELCHLRELNHSPRFWALVAQTIPDYRERRKKLRLVDLLTDS